MSDLNSSDRLRQILQDHELYRSVRKMSSYAARSPGSSPSQVTLPAYEHKMPRAHLASSTGKASPSLDPNPTGKFLKKYKVSQQVLAKIPKLSWVKIK